MTSRVRSAPRALISQRFLEIGRRVLRCARDDPRRNGEQRNSGFTPI
jgi:hypothetical protein